MTESTKEDVNEYFEKLFKAEYKGLLQYALSIIKSQGRVLVGDPMGKAEAAVQEMFALAWKKNEDLRASKSPVGWLYKALQYKIQELLYDENQWFKRIMRVSECTSHDQSEYTLELRSELMNLLPKEDYLLLHQLYVEGFTYQELCRRMGISKSAFAMRIKRIKERFIKNYGES